MVYKLPVSLWITWIIIMGSHGPPVVVVNLSQYKNQLLHKHKNKNKYLIIMHFHSLNIIFCISGLKEQS